MAFIKVKSVSGTQSKLIKHAKRYENMTHKEK